jgi:DNA-binding GntR family transcriptional regulator
MKRFSTRKVRASKPKAPQAYAELKRALLLAKFKAGDVLSIRTLASSLGTSTMPVREAVTRLVTEGGLESLPRLGVRVPILTASQEREIYVVRYALEGVAAELAAASISDEEIAKMEAFELQLEDAIERKAAAEAALANVQFHLTLYRSCGIALLIEMIEAIYLRYAPSLYAVLDKLPVGSERKSAFVHTHHYAILNALRQRDRSGVRRALEQDLADAVSFSNLQSL